MRQDGGMTVQDITKQQTDMFEQLSSAANLTDRNNVMYNLRTTAQRIVEAATVEAARHAEQGRHAKEVHARTAAQERQSQQAADEEDDAQDMFWHVRALNAHHAWQQERARKADDERARQAEGGACRTGPTCG